MHLINLCYSLRKLSKRDLSAPRVHAPVTFVINTPFTSRWGLVTSGRVADQVVRAQCLFVTPPPRGSSAWWRHDFTSQLDSPGWDRIGRRRLRAAQRRMSYRGWQGSLDRWKGQQGHDPRDAARGDASARNETSSGHCSSSINSKHLKQASHITHVVLIKRVLLQMLSK